MLNTPISLHFPAFPALIYFQTSAEHTCASLLIIHILTTFSETSREFHGEEEASSCFYMEENGEPTVPDVFQKVCCMNSVLKFCCRDIFAPEWCWEFDEQLKTIPFSPFPPQTEGISNVHQEQRMTPESGRLNNKIMHRSEKPQKDSWWYLKTDI